MLERTSRFVLEVLPYVLSALLRRSSCLDSFIRRRRE